MIEQPMIPLHPALCQQPAPFPRALPGALPASARRSRLPYARPSPGAQAARAGRQARIRRTAALNVPLSSRFARCFLG